MLRIFLFFSLLLPIPLLVSAQEVHMRGWVEHARIMPDRLLMSAKLDSGAQTTSIHAEILSADSLEDPAASSIGEDSLEDTELDAMEKMNTRMIDGRAPDDPSAGDVEPYDVSKLSGKLPETVIFRLTSRGGKEVIYRAPVERWVSIRRRGGGSIVRPVVMMEMCIAGLMVEGEVNLADRTGFNYPLLIGRNMLGDAEISVDSRQVFASKRACPQDE